MAPPEVVDLTALSSSPPIHIYGDGITPDVDRKKGLPKNPSISADANVSPEDGELSRAVKPATVTQQKQRKRKNSQQDSTTAKEGSAKDGDKRRRRGREQEESSRDKSHSPSNRAARRRNLRETPADTLFFVDEKPANIRDPYVSTALAGPSRKEQDGLLLPSHVRVFDGSAETQELPPTDDDDDDFIDYLEVSGDRNFRAIRYFYDTHEPDTKTRFVCKNCGEEGDHRAKDCPHQICLTCGARNEHSTRSCPISKTCFTCGMKGHINKTCPNRYASRDDPFDDCDRCGSRSHYSKECPTLWRIYEYLPDAGRDSVLKDRASKKDLALGLGGEGYIGAEDWCFNCGDAEHLGDDCTEAPHPHDFPREPSAFSEHNTRSGPFFDPRASPSKRPSRKLKRDWDDEDRWGDGHGSSLPINVGKQGRKKDRRRMEELDARAREDDDDDFFSRNVKDRGMPKTERDDHKVKHTGIVIKGAAEKFPRDPPRNKPLSLEERLGPPQDRKYIDFPRGGGDNRQKDKGRDRDRGRDRDWDRDRDRDRGRGGGGGRSRDRAHDRGPRYRGGYPKS